MDMEKMKAPSIAEVRALAMRLHEGQTDKGGLPYFLHVEAVALALTPFGKEAMIVGYLHDVVEDTDITIEDLRLMGIPEVVLEAIAYMSRNLHPVDATYMDMIRLIAAEAPYLARLGKIADNAHNSRKDRVIPDAEPKAVAGMAKRYAQARKVLYPAVKVEDIRVILAIVHPELLDELPAS